MYRASMIKDIEFIRGIIYEDFPWWGEVLMRTEKATIINLPLYYYYPNRGSSIFSTNEDRKIESLKIGLKAAESIHCEDAYKMQAWEQKFIMPFKSKLEKKIKQKR
jgi:hypothetical protein